MKKPIQVCAILAFVLTIMPNAPSRTIHVPADFTTIQQAIDASVDGDTVLVDPGLYMETIDFAGKAVTVQSTNGPNFTTINAGKQGSVVTFSSREELNSVLDGFTLTNGSGTYTTPTHSHGGGIYCDNSSPTILNNRIQDNHALGYHGSYGGGIHCGGAASPLIKNNFIANNTSEGGCSEGGGIHCEYGAGPTLINNVILKNLVTGGWYGHGGGIYSVSSTMNLINNHFAENIASKSGGGIYSLGSNMTLINNTFRKNTASYGGGVRCNGSIIQISNSIFWNNEAYSMGKEFYITHRSSVFSINHSNVEGGLASVEVEPDVVFDWGMCMIDVDPVFVDPSPQDPHLAWTSPCINRGMNIPNLSEDFEGDPRRFMGTTDMGADEFTGIHPLQSSLFSLSASTGGKIQLALQGESIHGGADYMVLGSLSGTAPGIPLPNASLTLPLHWDFFTLTVLQWMNTPSFRRFMGALDAQAEGMAVFDTLGPVPGMVGSIISFAFVLYNPCSFVSNPLNIKINP